MFFKNFIKQRKLQVHLYILLRVKEINNQNSKIIFKFKLHKLVIVLDYS